MYEVFFDLEDNLCQRYPALTPFIVRRERVGEVFLLINRINAKAEREQGIRRKDEIIEDGQGNRVIRREAGDDFF